MSQSFRPASVSNDGQKIWAVRFLLLIAGLGGLLYGIDIGIIAGALPYLEATSKLNANDLSVVVAAVLLGSMIGTLPAGMLADWLGRRKLMTLSGILFVASIPMIALSQGYTSLVLGRLLQGISAGLVGVAVPLYLAECLPAKSRGKGTGIFQWLLTIGIVAAAGIGLCFSWYVDSVSVLNDADKLLAAKDVAWRGIFWVALPPGLFFLVGSFLVAESPRWLFRRGRKDAALAALLRSRTSAQAAAELKEMEEAAAEEATSTAGQQIKESLLGRKYVIPFILSCVILACTQATGVNSIIQYNTTILIQAGLNDTQAHIGYTILTFINVLATIIGIVLVDRKGRKFLLGLGTAGIIASLLCTALIFHQTEKQRVDCAEAVQAMVNSSEQKAEIKFDDDMARKLLSAKADAAHAIADRPTTLIVIYSYGDFRAATNAVRSDDKTAKPLEITRKSIPGSKLAAVFSNPLGDVVAAGTAPLKIENALITPVPSAANGWLAAVCTYCAMAFFALGPGVCVWLALSELMPTRIRSNGMSIALMLNQFVSTAIAAIFLPTVGRFGYSTIFVVFAGFTLIYFVTAVFFLPETKGKTLEEIEEYFSGHKPSAPR